MARSEAPTAKGDRGIMKRIGTRGRMVIMALALMGAALVADSAWASYCSTRCYRLGNQVICNTSCY
jgi:hypothetical protein